MPTPRNISGKQIAQLREKAGLSQAGLAAKLQREGWDVSRDMVIQIEHQRRQVADFELALLAQSLDVDVADLFAGKISKATLLEVACGMKKGRPGHKPKTP